ncbi:MAG: isoprenylcysteine carboxylmethyltransferase family protein [Terriglobales bacterium]
MTSWSRLAQRIRVPLGFALAALYFWLAQPTWTSLAIGAVIAAPGLALRALASGHVRKNTELTTTGPYAYTRNPLYVGSAIIGVGFAAAARSLWVVLALVLLFLLIYLPVVRSEEAYLRAQFPEYGEYARRVPRFSLTFSPPQGAAEGFSRELYLKHREYNAVLGAALMLAALVLKLLWR